MKEKLQAILQEALAATQCVQTQQEAEELKKLIDSYRG